MFKSQRRFAHWAAAFAFALIAAACGDSTADDAAEAGGDTVAAEVTTTEAAMTDDTSESMDDHMEGEESEHMEGDDHEESEHMEGDDHEESEHGEGGGEEPVDVPEDARVVFVTMNEWGYDPPSFTAKAGETVVYRITNAGIFEHEFRLSNGHRIEEHIASGHEGHGDEGGHHGDEADILIELQPGAVGELIVTYPEDTSIFTNIVCLIPDHYENGMVTDLTYEN